MIEGGEGISYMGIRVKGILGKENGLCKDPEVGMCLAHTRDGEEANRTGLSQREDRR